MNCMETSLPRRDMEKIAAFHIRNYFSDKSVPCEVDLYSQRYVDTVLGNDICNGVDVAYAAMDRHGMFPEPSNGGHVIEDDIRYVIRTLRAIRHRVPQEFSAGILLMHLEIMEGVPF